MSTLDFTRVTLYSFVSNTENKVYSSFPTKTKPTLLFCQARRGAETTTQFRGPRVHLTQDASLSSLIYPRTKSLSNLKPSFY